MEELVAEFLGISMEDQHSGSIQLTQKGLIDRIPTVLNLLQGSHMNKSPAEIGALPNMENGDECSETWNYVSIVEMLMYVSLNFCPDITFAVRQCARFMHKPK